MRVVGIDPGLTGAIAFLGFSETPEVYDCPTVTVKRGKKSRTEFDPTSMFQLGDFINPAPEFVLIEKQQSMKNQGVASTFKTGMGYGFWLMAAHAWGYPLEIVTPQKWKKAMGCTADKGQSLLVAQGLFPGVDLGRRKDAGRAEALLIAEYGRRLLAGRVGHE